MSRNTKIIAITVLLFFAVFAVLYLLNSAKKKNVSQSVKQTQSQGYMPNLPGENLIKIADSKRSDEIKSAIGNFSVGQQITSAGSTDVRELRLVDKENQPVSLENFQEALGLNINSAVEGMVDGNFYSLISCLRNNGGYDLGIMLNIKHFGQSEKVNYSTLLDQINEAMKGWEKTILKDLHPFLFPQEKFSESQLNQELVFREGKYRYANIILPSGWKSSINYQIFGDPVVITTSPECLNKVSASLIDE